MNNKISIAFGIPKNGWLPVDFHYKNFRLEFDASDALNNPIEELYNAITTLQNNQSTRITWWLEPVAYFFDIENKGNDFVLSISKIEDLHNEQENAIQLIGIVGDEKEIIEPLSIVLKQFSLHVYDEKDWSFCLVKKVN